MRQIEFTEAVRIHDGQHMAGDRKSYPADEAGEYIRLGWARDPETGEEGTRKPGAQALQVNSVVTRQIGG